MSLQIPAATAPRRPGLFVLVAATALAPVALNVFVPSLPGLRASLNIDYATAQLTLSIYLAAFAVAQLIIGPLSDRYGRRPVLLSGTALFVLASLGCALATSFEQLIAMRILQAAGGCSGVALARAVVRDMYDRDEAASKLGYVTMAMVVAPMVAPGIGGFLDQLGGWRAGFVFVAAFGALVYVLSLAQMHETHHERDGSAGFAKLAHNSIFLLRKPAFIGYSLNVAFSTATYLAFLAGAPFIVTDIIGGTPVDYGLYFVFISIGYMAGNFLTGRLTMRYGANRINIAGNLVSLIALGSLVGVIMLDQLHLLTLFLPMALTSVGGGLIVPSGTTSAINVRPDIAGAGAGLTGFLQVGAGTLATVAVSALHDGTAFATVAVMVGCGATSASFLVLGIWSAGRDNRR
ncbi:MAG: multidrug effflux MFS transporter [Hyphomicrobiales bacterium]|nr:multidrug effflux MFS transporter [Hyphomicrobiales bacterium]